MCGRNLHFFEMSVQLLCCVEIFSGGSEVRLFKIQSLYLLFSDAVCSDLVKCIVLVGELPLKGDVSGPDDSASCRYPDSVDVG
jgi:hypothetical protein